MKLFQKYQARLEKKRQEDQERRKIEETLSKNMASVKIAINDEISNPHNNSSNNLNHQHQNGGGSDSNSLNESSVTDNLTVAQNHPIDYKPIYMDMLYNFECERLNFKLEQSAEELNETDERSNAVSDVMCTMMEALCDENESYHSIDAKIIEEAAATEHDEVVLVNGKLDDSTASSNSNNTNSNVANNINGNPTQTVTHQIFNFINFLLVFNCISFKR